MRDIRLRLDWISDSEWLLRSTISSGSPYRDEITLGILQLQESNRLEILKRRWWEGGQCPKEEDHRAKGECHSTAFILNGQMWEWYLSSHLTLQENTCVFHNMSNRLTGTKLLPLPGFIDLDVNWPQWWEQKQQMTADSFTDKRNVSLQLLIFLCCLHQPVFAQCFGSRGLTGSQTLVGF